MEQVGKWIKQYQGDNFYVKEDEGVQKEAELLVVQQMLKTNEFTQ